VVPIASILALIAIPVLQAPAQAVVQATFFVSPTGDDANPGTSALPFKTLGRARDAVRAINTGMTGDVVVDIAPGDYYVDSTVDFDNQDSGTSGHRVIYQVTPGAQPGSARFIGGSKVTSGWSLVSRTGADADLPASAGGQVYRTLVGTGVNFNTLYVNGSRATMARTPNLSQSGRFPAARTSYLRSAGGSVSSLVYTAGDLDATALAGLTNAQARGELDAQVYEWDGGTWDWMTDTIPIGNINTTSRALQFKAVAGHPELNRARYPTGSGARYFLQGNLGFLDQPGEYYFNKTTGYLYYYPAAGSGPIGSQDIVIPTLDKIIDIKGSSRTNQVQNLTFDGLSFEDTRFPDYYSYGWNYNDGGGGMFTYPAEAAGATLPSYSETTERVEFQVGAVTLQNARDVNLTNVKVKNAGMFGIELYLGTQNIDISNCLVEHTGHGGINIEGGYPGTGGDATGDSYTKNNTVDNCLIHDIGELVGQTSGVTVNNATGNTISHSEIYNSPRRAMLIIGGWQRNTDPATPMNDNQFNRMTDLYAHHNHFDHLYLHDSQQDGGDDGAFFGAMLFRGQTDFKPNYVNQMLIDGVGANSSMTDYAPNGMNLDMGDAGFELSNLKVVNPQNFNVEVNTRTQYNDLITFTNTNVDYGTHTNYLPEFDDSLMDYANIGVSSSYPAAYEPVVTPPTPPSNVYFSDAFEGLLDLTKWTYRGKKPLITKEWMSEGALGGKSALEIFSDNAPAGSKPVLVRDFPTNLNKVVTLKLFDRGSNNMAVYDSGRAGVATVRSLARADDGAHALAMGVDTTTSTTAYVVQDGAAKTVTSVPRSYGWHTLKWDYTSGSDVKLYVDDVLVKTTSALSSFDHLELGADDGLGISYYDQVLVSGGTGSGTAPALTPPPANLAQSATITVSGQYNANYSRLNVADDLTGMSGRGEWASNSSLTPWIQLAWSAPQRMNDIVLYDRPNTVDWLKGGTLSFSDGSTLSVPALPNDGSPLELRFPDKDVTSVKLQVTSGAGSAVGLSEFQVFANGTLPPPTALNLSDLATATASTQASSSASAAKVRDGVVGQTGSGEWVAASGDSAPWVRLTWGAPQTSDQVVLFDRAGSSGRVTGGTLTFSDGSSVPVPALPDDGSASAVTFPAKTFTWVQLDITGSTGTPGLSEMRAIDAYPDLSTSATVVGSSQYSAGYAPGKVADGVIGQNGTGEWAVAAGDADPYVKLSWPYLQSVNKVLLFDRTNSTDWVQSGTLTFSDGSSVPVSALPNDGSRLVVTFPTKNVTWMRFDIDSNLGLAGLSELEAFDVPNLAQSSTATVSSQYSTQYAAGNLIDGVTGQTGTGEWAKADADTTPWAKLSWPSQRAINELVLYDRANTTDRVTSGTLTFSDGSTVPFGALPNDGTATVVSFPSKNVDWVKVNISTYTGLPGLAEIEAYSGYVDPVSPNLAPAAAITGSSQYSAYYAPANVADNVVGVHGSGEWAIAASDMSRWVKLTWSSTQAVSKIVLYDRPNTIDQVTGGTLTFSDGSTISVPSLPNDGSAYTLTFATKNVTSVELKINSFTGLPGLSELQAF
jgi:hypothetical protein